MRRAVALGLVLIGALVVAGCGGQVAGELTFGDHRYRETNAAAFKFSTSDLQKLGETSVAAEDGSPPTVSVYSLRGVDPEVILVGNDGSSTRVYVERTLFLGLASEAPGAQPLAGAIPALCPYWVVKPSECP